MGENVNDFPCVFCSPPDYPSTPFGEPALVLFDVLRLLVILGSAGFIAMTPRILFRESVSVGQRARFLSSVLASLFISTTMIVHFGDYAHWRLIIAVLWSFAMLWGTYSFYRWECPGGYATFDHREGSGDVETPPR